MSAARRDKFRVDFNAALSELAFNSRPIILNLTTVAEDNLEFADDIVLLIEKRIDLVRRQLYLPLCIYPHIASQSSYE